MENYIVRIYRRDTTDPEKMAGTLESVENQTEDAFTSLGNLIDMFSPRLRLHTPPGESSADELTPALERETTTFAD